MRHGMLRAQTEFDDISGQLPNNQQKDDPNEFRSVVERGRSPWLTTSQILQTPLLVSFWVCLPFNQAKALNLFQKHDPLPSIIGKNFGVLTIDEISGKLPPQ